MKNIKMWICKNSTQNWQNYKRGVKEYLMSPKRDEVHKHDNPVTSLVNDKTTMLN